MGIHWTGIVLGLGAIISFGYWTTDFLVVQRVLTAKDLRSAKIAPIIGSAFQDVRSADRDSAGAACAGRSPIQTGPESAAGHRRHSYNEVLPLMLARYCGPGLLGLGLPR